MSQEKEMLLHVIDRFRRGVESGTVTSALLIGHHYGTIVIESSVTPDNALTMLRNAYHVVSAPAEGST